MMVEKPILEIQQRTHATERKKSATRLLAVLSHLRRRLLGQPRFPSSSGRAQLLFVLA
jgi:hypothetical protein